MTAHLKPRVKPVHHIALAHQREAGIAVERDQGLLAHEQYGAHGRVVGNLLDIGLFGGNGRRALERSSTRRSSHMQCAACSMAVRILHICRALSIALPSPSLRRSSATTTEWMHSVWPAGSCALMLSSVRVSPQVSVPQINPSSAMPSLTPQKYSPATSARSCKFSRVAASSAGYDAASKANAAWTREGRTRAKFPGAMVVMRDGIDEVAEESASRHASIDRRRRARQKSAPEGARAHRRALCHL